ncbi:hypothetical protein [Streptococcus sp. DD13]|uniref:hypothetical protein n=1 Tax=Streptococcus sp. DD13 TaxID=1777881 RepID=UPI00079B502F|nr:hypothetical protein [Streptococcus sp. DD13]KXT77719.1 hypothetical protein STRDD13_01399 [Streptococcus sp. DD13]
MKGKKVKKILGSVSVFLILSATAYTVYSQFFAYRFEEEHAANITSMGLFGDQKQYLSVVVEEGTTVGWGSGITVSQNYLVSVDFKNRIDRLSHPYQMDEGESVMVTTYDLNTSDFTKRSFDLADRWRKANYTYQIISVYAITYQGEDYLAVKYEENEYTSGMLWYSLEKGTFIKYGGKDFQSIFEFLDGTYRTGLDEKLFEMNMDIRQYSLNYNFNKAKGIENLNISREYPQIAQNLSNGGSIYVRPLFSDKATWFNTIIHWFAPKEQEVMELYAPNGDTGEKTPIRSYEDYEAWAKAHPEFGTE